MYRTTTTFHTGDEFERGETDRRRGRNEPMPGVQPEPLGPEVPQRAAAGPQRQAAINAIAERTQHGTQ